MYHLQNPVNGLGPFRVLVAQLVEHPPGVRKVMGSNPKELVSRSHVLVSSRPRNKLFHRFPLAEGQICNLFIDQKF